MQVDAPLPPPPTGGRRKRPLSAAAERARKKRRRNMSTPQSSSEVIEISISSDEEDFTEEPTWRTIHGVALSTKDKDCIVNGEWLNDKIVYAAMLLMKHDKDVLPVGSLQDPLYGQDLSFQAAEGHLSSRASRGH